MSDLATCALRIFGGTTRSRRSCRRERWTGRSRTTARSGSSPRRGWKHALRGDEPRRCGGCLAYGSVTVWASASESPTESTEAGLGYHLVPPRETDVRGPDDRPTISNTRVMQFIADTCATVAEAVTVLDQVRIYSTPVNGEDLRVSLRSSKTRLETPRSLKLVAAKADPSRPLLHSDDE